MQRSHYKESSAFEGLCTQVPKNQRGKGSGRLSAGKKVFLTSEVTSCLHMWNFHHDTSSELAGPGNAPSHILVPKFRICNNHVGRGKTSEQGKQRLIHVQLWGGPNRVLAYRDYYKLDYLNRMTQNHIQASLGYLDR